MTYFGKRNNNPSLSDLLAPFLLPVTIHWTKAEHYSFYAKMCLVHNNSDFLIMSFWLDTMENAYDPFRCFGKPNEHRHGGCDG